MKAFVTTRGRTEIIGKEIVKDNVTSTEGFMMASPSTCCISLKKGSLTKELIEESKSFCINLLEGYEKEAKFCTSYSGRYMDKIPKCKFLVEECDTIDCLRVSFAKSYFECELMDKVELDDFVVFFGKILRKKVVDG